MSEPFVIFALPRSRTFWLANFLNSDERPCWHDALVGCASTDEWFDFFGRGLAGTVETAGMLGAELIHWRMPSAKLVVLRRPIKQVIDSLHKAQVPFDEQELFRRAVLLDELAAKPFVETVEFKDLEDERQAEWLYSHCNGSPPVFGRYKRFASENLQIDMPARLKFLAENQERVAGLKQDLADRLEDMKGTSGVVIRQESYLTMGLEAEGLGALHFAEVNSDLMPQRKYALDHNTLRALYLQGTMRVFTLRRAGKLQGYITWNVFYDPESQGLLTADQGAWFVLPQAKGLGLKLFKQSLDELRKLGVQVANPHHHLIGRGASLGKFFSRLGAVPAKQCYSLWIGDGANG